MSSTAATAAAVGIDLGSYHARVATFDENLGHPVCAHNHDGHRTTRVVVLTDHQAAPSSSASATTSDPVTASHLPRFLQEKLLQLAIDAAHTKNLHVVSSIPNDLEEESSAEAKEWISVLRKAGGVLTEAAAVCLAYDLDEELLSSSENKHPRILVVDAGASGLKVALLKATNGMWCLESTHKLPSVNGTELVESLAKSVSQQFEVKNRFPRDEVWQSKKARMKLNRACELGLTTIQINNTAQIHVDGLYEGVDCNVTMSKAKFDHLSSKLVKEAKDFLKTLPINVGDDPASSSSSSSIDTVLLSGNMHTWLRPIVESVFPGKLFASSSIDPSEAIAIGCTKQARWNITHPAQQASSFPATLRVPVSPVAIAIGQDQVVIEEGTPLPALVNHTTGTATGGDENSATSVEIWQTKPSKKQLATLSDLVHPSTVRMLLSETGQLRISVGGQSIVIG